MTEHTPASAEANIIRAALPERAHLVGPIKGNAEAERWVVCEDAAGAEPIGFLSPTPIEALKTAFDVLQDNVALYRAKEKTTDAELNAFHTMLREAGYSPDPAGLLHALEPRRLQEAVEAGVVRSALPRQVRLVGPIEDLDDSWRITDGKPLSQAVGPLSDSPAGALKGFLSRLDWTPDTAKSDGRYPPADTGTVTIDPPRSPQVFSITIPGRAVIEVHPDHIRIDR